ncbi:MAG: ATP-dependent DNA helicase, partial [Candidatus Nanopelagicales bacterium]|nr:ATP-dependent DNA helicase [Candidatus Nanopelagicales bacterium]
DLISPNPLFGDRDLVVVDEVHELERYLSNAWGYCISPELLDRVVGTAVRRVPPKLEGPARLARHLAADAEAVLAGLREPEPGRLTGPLPSRIDGALASLRTHAKELADAFDRMAEGGPAGSASAGSGSSGTQDADRLLAAARLASRAQLQELNEAIDALRSEDSGMVRWAEVQPERDQGRLWAAPLEVGRRFRRELGDRVLVATSATASVAGDFEPMAAALGLDEIDSDQDDDAPDAVDPGWLGVDVGSPFDYRQQAILYVPRNFPAPIGRERTDHSAAVLDELTDLVQAAGGRTLALFTTTAATRRAAGHLRAALRNNGGGPISILEHGELPAPALTAEFAEDETSVLCATMGMWSGLDVAGPACSLVVIDKIPFAPMDDPLSAARRERSDQTGRDGFHEVYVTRAALMLTQGVGRLIRRRQDRGLVAILDPRLHTKRYGVALLRSLPPMWRTSDPAVARAALSRLVAENGSTDLPATAS